MPDGLETVRSIADLRERVRDWRGRGLRIGLVPTMGALHDGHLSLVARALALSDRVVATVFVNPTQFGPDEDFAVYPRDEAGDAARLVEAGTHLLFAPGVEEMYPEGSVTRVTVPGIGDVLEGTHRPGFFTGVATIVTKLLLQALPDVAVFGEKDFQQLQVIRQLVRDLDVPVAIEGAPTVREPDGLAMSSRNAYLTPEERAVAPMLNRTLLAMAERFRSGEDPDALSAWAAGELTMAGFASVDYMTVRDVETLEPEPAQGRAARVLGAAHLGRARLIDNVPV